MLLTSILLAGQLILPQKTLVFDQDARGTVRRRTLPAGTIYDFEAARNSSTGPCFWAGGAGEPRASRQLTTDSILIDMGTQR